MPGLVPPIADEREALLAFLAQQRAALRYAAYGLTDGQARRPALGQRAQRGRPHQARGPGGAGLDDLSADGDTTVFAPTDEYEEGFRLSAGQRLWPGC